VAISTGPAQANPLPVILYLKNFAAPRTGTEVDKTILQDFIIAGYLVAELDFSARTNARVPFCNCFNDCRHWLNRFFQRWNYFCSWWTTLPRN